MSVGRRRAGSVRTNLWSPAAVRWEEHESDVRPHAEVLSDGREPGASKHVREIVQGDVFPSGWDSTVGSWRGNGE